MKYGLMAVVVIGMSVSGAYGAAVGPIDAEINRLLGAIAVAHVGEVKRFFQDAAHRELSVVRTALRSAEGFVHKKSARKLNRDAVLAYMHEHAGKPVRVVDLKRNARAWNDLMHGIKDAQLEVVKRIVPAIISPKNLTDWLKDPARGTKATVLEFAELCISNQQEIVDYLKKLLTKLRASDDRVDALAAGVAALDVATGGGGGEGASGESPA